MRFVLKRLSLIAALAILAWGAILVAQARRPALIPTRQVTEDVIALLEKQLLETADAMPEDKYSFVPTGGQFEGVRSFGEQVKHLAAANYILAAAMARERPPSHAGQETGPEEMKAKAQIMIYLKGSFAALHRSATLVSDKNLTLSNAPSTSPLGTRATALGLVQEALIHTENHYGQMVIYLRMNGIVPPASR